MIDEFKKVYESAAKDSFERLQYHVLERQFKNIDLHGKKMLDIGCGKGLVDIYLSFLFPDVEIYCLDADEGHGAEKGNLNFLKEQIQHFCIKNITIVNKDFTDNGLNDNMFDVVIAYHSFHHIIEENLKPSKDEGNFQRWLEQINEVHRLLKPGGIFIVREISGWNIWNHARIKWHLGHMEWEIHPTLKDFNYVFKHSKFRSVSCQYEVSHKLRRYAKLLQNNHLYGYFINPCIMFFARK